MSSWRSKSGRRPVYLGVRRKRHRWRCTAARVEKVAAHFAGCERHRSHSLGIDREQVRKEGIKIGVLEADQGLQDAVLSVHHANDACLAGPAVKIVENYLGLREADPAVRGARAHGRTTARNATSRETRSTTFGETWARPGSPPAGLIPDSAGLGRCPEGWLMLAAMGGRLARSSR
jgi:hypothetical protein